MMFLSLDVTSGYKLVHELQMEAAASSKRYGVKYECDEINKLTEHQNP